MPTKEYRVLTTVPNNSGFTTTSPPVQMGQGGNQNPHSLQISSTSSSGYGNFYMTWGLQYTGENSGLMFEPGKHCGFQYVGRGDTSGSSHGGNGYIVGLNNKVLRYSIKNREAVPQQRGSL